MKHTEMKVGEIYFSNYGGSEWLVRYDGMNSNQIKILNYMYNIFKPNASFHIYNGSWGEAKDFEVELRDATYEEKRWFEACEKAGKFVKKEEMELEDYSIY